MSEQEPTSRRRFLARSALAVGATTRLSTLGGPGVTLAVSPRRGMRRLVETTAQEILYAPNDLLISVQHTAPSPWPSVGRLTGVLNATLRPFGLQLIPPPPPNGKPTSSPPRATGRGLLGGWTFAPVADKLSHSVLRYQVVPVAGQRRPVLVAAAIISADLQRLNAPLGGGIQISGATPNWALSGEPSGYIVGGPGGRPAPETMPPGTTRWHFTFPAAVTKVAPPGGERVLVVVLDTSPDQVEVDGAAATYGSHNSLLVEIASGGAHPVAAWEDVLGEGGFPAAHGPSQAFPMRDHGLFVAGIIRDIAPACTLRVVRVLNDWGGGYLTTLIAGLEYVHDLAAAHDGPVVVNLSLTAKVPVQAALPALYGTLLKDYPGLKNPYAAPEDASWPLFDVISSLSSRPRYPVVFVAAAGNDSAHRGSRPLDPRVPSVYDTTLGVAAIDGTGKRAAYSNRGDDTSPILNGVATYGGAASSGSGGSGEIDAVRGLFSATTFPPDAVADPSNTTGWARWMGTSFATPVISGLCANLLARQPAMTAADMRATLLALALAATDRTLNCKMVQANQTLI